MFDFYTQGRLYRFAGVLRASFIKRIPVLDPCCGSRDIIMTTADSNDGCWVLSPLLEKQNMK